jgi:hypothetical protein
MYFLAGVFGSFDCRSAKADRSGFRIELLQQWRVFTNPPSCNSAPQRPDDGRLSPLRIRSKTHRAPTVPSSPSEFGQWPDDMRGSFLCGSVPPVDREKQRPLFEYTGGSHCLVFGAIRKLPAKARPLGKDHRLHHADAFATVCNFGQDVAFHVAGRNLLTSLE